MTSALLRVNLETLYDDEGLPLFSHIAGEAITLFKCKPVEVQIRHNEKHCCSEISIWVGTNFSTPAFAQPTSKRITPTCTPRICNNFETPLFNVGTEQEPRWIQISRFGSIIQSEAPKKFVPLSTNKDDQIILRHSGIYSAQQKEEFQKFSLVKNARELVNSEIVYRMFSPTSLNALDDALGSPTFSAQDYLTNKLQQVFLPWRLSLFHGHECTCQISDRQLDSNSEHKDTSL